MSSPTTMASEHSSADHSVATLDWGIPRNEVARASNKENSTPRLRLRLRRGNGKAPEEGVAEAEPSRPAGSGLKIRLRGIQAALKEHNEMHAAAAGPSTNSMAGQKRSREEMTTQEDSDTDSEIELFAPLRRHKKAAKLRLKQQLARIAERRKAKKQKTEQAIAAPEDDDDTMFDAAEIQQQSSNNAGLSSLPLPPALPLSLPPSLPLPLATPPPLKRIERILDPKKPEHARLIATATKIGSDYYDSDFEDEASDSEAVASKDKPKPSLFRNVTWGPYASDFSNPADFPTTPDFLQFVPGRFELLPDGRVADQKAKLIVKLTDKHGQKRVFTNPPPRDWSSQEAISALNKRTVQQIRRNTAVRFREVVKAYLPVERRWILSNLEAGRPKHGWKKFVEEFNAVFEGKVVQGDQGPRPGRSHSSLTKEVERFGPEFYSKGLVPGGAKKDKKE